MIFTRLAAIVSAVLMASAVPVAEVTQEYKVVAAPNGEVVDIEARAPLAAANLFKACTDANFGGSCFNFFTGSDGSVTGGCQNFASNLQDDISSLQLLNSGIKCTYWVDNGCSGSAVVLTPTASSISDLATFGDGAKNDALSSWSCVLSN